MATDFTKLPIEIFLDLVNKTNSISLSPTDVMLGPVAALVGGNKNSAITMTALPGSGFYGPRDLTYDRKNLAEVPGNRSAVFRSEGAITIADLIPRINAAYEINLQPGDYVDAILPTTDVDIVGGDKLFSLTAKPESLIWNGSLLLAIEGMRTGLGEIITTTLLSGFDFPIHPKTLNTTVLSGFDFPI